MIASACLTLAAVHVVIGLKQKAPANFWFSLTAVGAAAVTAFELVSMRASTPERLAAALRWEHVPFFVIIFSLVWFVRSYFGAGRLWLGWTAIGLRAISLVINFAKPPNVDYASITGVRPLHLWWGEHVFLPVGTLSPWRRVGELSSIVLLVFLIDATHTVWLRGDRARAVICGSSVLFLLAATVHAGAIHAGWIQSPYLVGVAYLGIVGAMSNDLTREVVRASELSRELRASEAGWLASRELAVLAAEEAQRAEAWFRRVFEGAPNAMIIADSTGAIRLVNARALSTFGYVLEELVGLPVETLIPEGYDHPKNRNAYFEKPIPRPMGDGQNLHGRRKDGTEIPIEIGLSPVSSRHGTFVLASIVDITERRRSDLEFERLRNEVAHLSRLTTIGELAGSLAHELNQPLTAILSNAQAAQRLLERTPRDIEEVSEILHDIVESDRHAGEVIQRLRAMLRKGEERFEALDVTEIVQDVLKLARSDLLNHGVMVTADLAAGLPTVAGDRVQLLQVLLNLVLNGCDAMAREPRDGRRLDFGTEPLDGGVHLWVRDCGGGIPEGKSDRLFEPFFTTKSSGMGLGLSVCRTIVSAHGGTIWATNNTGKGATLHIRLPGGTPEGAPAAGARESGQNFPLGA
jgi:PAS domain S-box-containing protein